MHPIEFKGQNAVFGKDQPEYLPLPALLTSDGIVLTCWKFSFKERLKVLFSGRLFLQVVTNGTPLQPLLPTVENPIQEPPPPTT